MYTDVGRPLVRRAPFLHWLQGPFLILLRRGRRRGDKRGKGGRVRAASARGKYVAISSLLYADTESCGSVRLRLCTASTAILCTRASRVFPACKKTSARARQDVAGGLDCASPPLSFLHASLQDHSFTAMQTRLWACVYRGLPAAPPLFRGRRESSPTRSFSFLLM